MSTRSVLSVLLLLPALLIVVWHVSNYAATTGRLGRDAEWWLAAGERLNAGHGLYELQPGDRPVPADPPFHTAPLIWPPTIAVIWAPLAALPSELGVAIWMAAVWITLGVVLTWLAIRVGFLVPLAATALSIGIAWEVELGNVNAFILAASVLVVAKPQWGAVLAGVLAAVKVTPLALVAWLVVRSPRSHGVVAVTALALSALVTVAVAGPDAVAGYLRTMSETIPLRNSVAGIAFTEGFVSPAGARAISLGLTVACLVVILLLRRRRWLSFGVALVAMTLASPAVHLSTLVILLAAFTPLVYESPDDVQRLFRLGRGSADHSRA